MSRAALRRTAKMTAAVGAAGLLAVGPLADTASAGSVRVFTSGPNATVISAAANRANVGSGMVNWSSVRVGETNPIVWPWFVCNTAGWAANVNRSGNLYFVTERPVRNGCAYQRSEWFDNLNGRTTNQWGIRFKWRSAKTSNEWWTVGEVWS